MSDINRLGANIRSLRKAYGETQPQLGDAIHVEYNTVSYYEAGKREPSKEILTAIAKHYFVSVEELLHSDLTSIGTITINDKNAFWKSIDIILPIVSSETALKNESFKRAFIAHKAFYNQLHTADFEGIDFDTVDAFVDNYITAIEDDIEVEVSANLIALWFLKMLFFKTGPEIIKNLPAPLTQTFSISERIEIESVDPSFDADLKEILSEVADKETRELITDMLTKVKESKQWSDLADYYLALQYTWNLVDNDLDLGFNQRIGIEMMSTFASVKNSYAARYLKFIARAISGSSSRPVKDK